MVELPLPGGMDAFRKADTLWAAASTHQIDKETKLQICYSTKKQIDKLQKYIIETWQELWVLSKKL